MSEANGIKKSPFDGMTRLRMPGLHMITAVENGVPLREALAAHFFDMLHDKVAHTCLIRDEAKDLSSRADQAMRSASSPDAAGLSLVFGIKGQSALASEEWSYLPHEEASIFYILADGAVEQTQRWIAQGVEPPYEIPRGNLVERPAWASLLFDDPERAGSKVNEEIQSLLAQFS